MKARVAAYIGFTIFGCAGSKAAPNGPQALPYPPFPRIDAHVHVYDPSPEYHDLLKRLNLRVLNLCVVDRHDNRMYHEALPQHESALRLARTTEGRAAWTAALDPKDWESPGYAERWIAVLDEAFKQGAAGVKIYKDIGMELKSRNGQYLLPDHPVFQPIFAFMAARGKTLFAHLAEPIEAWQPESAWTSGSPHGGYLRGHRAYHVYHHPDRPSKAAILAARDRILERNPKLRVVGVHLGSMEDDVDEIARRFDLHPNFAVDTGGRVPDLMFQPSEKVKRFLVKYQDRVLYGTDLGWMPWHDAAKISNKMTATYARDWKYFSTNETLKTWDNRNTSGLALPLPVLRKLYYENAVRWVPGIDRLEPGLKP